MNDLTLNVPYYRDICLLHKNYYNNFFDILQYDFPCLFGYSDDEEDNLSNSSKIYHLANFYIHTSISAIGTFELLPIFCHNRFVWNCREKFINDKEKKPFLVWDNHDFRRYYDSL